MIVTLIGKNIIFKQKLPNIAIGNYWICDNDGKKIINIEGKRENWYISSNNHIKILKKGIEKYDNIAKCVQNKGNILQQLRLDIYDLNYIFFEESNNLFAIYCSPTYEDNYTKLDIINSQPILIGKGRNNYISYDNEAVKEHHARIFLSNGRLMLENYDNVFGTFVNNTPVLKKKKLLFNGDVIFIMGMKIIIMGRSIFINNPLNKVSFYSKAFKINEEYKRNKIPIEDVEEDDEEENLELYSERDYFARAPRIKNVIERETIKIDPPPQSQNKESTPLLYVIGTSLSMGLMSVITIISTVTGVASRNEQYKRFYIFYNYVISNVYEHVINSDFK